MSPEKNNLRIRHILFIMLPFILLLIIGYSAVLFDFKPLYPKKTETQTDLAAIIPILPSDPVIGNRKAGTTVIIFEDLGCEACKAQYEFLLSLFSTHKNEFKVIWKSLPVTKFPHDTRLAHEYAFCAKEQNAFEEFVSYAFANQETLTEATLVAISDKIKMNKNKLTECLESGTAAKAVTTSEEVASTLGIQAVPAIFINHKQIQPPTSLDAWKSVLVLP